MAKKKKQKQQIRQQKKKTELSKKFNHPTAERRAHGNIVLRNNVAQVDEPLRIDKLLNAGIIDEMQHLYGMQILTLWTITTRPHIRAMQYSPMGALPPDVSLLALNRMGAEDQFYRTMKQLRPREHELVMKICIEELGAIEAGRALRLPVNSITVYVREAFDALGEALAVMREERRQLQKQEEINA